VQRDVADLQTFELNVDHLASSELIVKKTKNYELRSLEPFRLFLGEWYDGCLDGGIRLLEQNQFDL